MPAAPKIPTADTKPLRRPLFIFECLSLKLISNNFPYKIRLHFIIAVYFSTKNLVRATKSWLNTSTTAIRQSVLAGAKQLSTILLSRKSILCH